MIDVFASVGSIIPQDYRSKLGSGAPIGTEYHWYILAHQNVRKLDANTNWLISELELD
jgi:hypothetical protein